MAGAVWAGAGVDNAGAVSGAAAGALCALPAAAWKNRAAETNVAIKKCHFEYKISSLAYQ
jgi:hypothetical protein